MRPSAPYLSLSLSFSHFCLLLIILIFLVLFQKFCLRMEGILFILLSDSRGLKTHIIVSIKTKTTTLAKHKALCSSLGLRNFEPNSGR